MEISSVDENGYTPLHHAVYRHDLNLVEQLLLHGADINATNKHGHSALHMAIFSCDPNMVEQLLFRGADINATNKFDQSALHLAVKNVRLQCVKVLLRYYCDVNLQDSKGDTALHLAIDSENTDLINLLCNCKRVDFTLQNEQGFNVLHHAVWSENIPAVKKLVTCAPYLVDTITGIYGSTVLHGAAFQMKHGREILSIFLSQHVWATVDLSDFSQRTPLHIATCVQNWPVVELLVRHDADISKADCRGDTVLHFAIYTLKDCITNIPNRKDSPFINAIWQTLAKQDAKTELALACFLASVDKSGKVLEHAKEEDNRTPLDVMKDLIDSAEFPRCAYLLRSYNYYNHLGVKNSLGLMKYLRTREIT